MAIVEMVMPKMGESIMECTVIQWLKQVGDRIETDESVLEVATDKVDTEVPASQAGVLTELLVNAGDVVAVGSPIARLNTDVAATNVVAGSAPTDGAAATGNVAAGAADAPAPGDVDVLESARELETSIAALSTRPAAATTSVAATSVAATSVAATSVAATLPVTAGVADAPVYENRFYSPLVLNIAREESIARAELDRIPGTGAGGRVTKKDMLAYVQQRSEAAPGNVVDAPTPTPSVKPATTLPPAGTAPATTSARSVNGQTDIIQMDRMRKMIAQRMVESKQTSPHVSSFVEADLTTLVQWRTRVKEQFKQQTGENLTYTPILIEAVARAIKDFPMINVSVEGDTILVKKSVNIGMAVALPTGNLIVPVIHDADQYNLVGLTKRVNDLSKRARDNKLTADDLAGGTYTVSNIGTFGNLMGTPIILQPQVAIMAFGAIVKKPAVIETPQGDLIGIRHLMFLSHSYDHRVVDGSLGGQFVRRVADYLEQFDPNRSF